MSHVDPAAAGSALTRSPRLARERSSWGETCLQAAGHLGHTSLVRRILELGVPSDPFAECLLGNPTRMVALLRGSAVEPIGIHSLPVLHFGVMSRNPETVARLLAAGASVNPLNASVPPLHSAVAIRDLFMVEQLLQAGADRDAADAFEDTALDWAVFIEGPGSLLVRRLSRDRRTEPPGKRVFEPVLEPVLG
jgi:hypothetical protein